MDDEIKSPPKLTERERLAQLRQKIAELSKRAKIKNASYSGKRGWNRRGETNCPRCGYPISKSKESENK